MRIIVDQVYDNDRLAENILKPLFPQPIYELHIDGNLVYSKRAHGGGPTFLLIPGDYKVRITANGYDPWEKLFTLTPHHEGKLTVKLKPQD